MAPEKLYVINFSEVTMQWNSHTGVTPYLQEAAGNAITAFTDGVVDDSFTFADTAITDFATITSIKLKGECKTSNADHFVTLLLTGVSGGAWSLSIVFEADGSGSWIPVESVELKATINSLARINEVAMKATKHNIGTGTLSFHQCHLEITVAVPVTENIMDGLVQC
jgi:hypothetical protein